MKIFEILQNSIKSMPVWPSSHAEIRDQLVNQEIVKETEVVDPNERKKRHDFINNDFYDYYETDENVHGAEYNKIHAHSKVRPKNINNKQFDILTSYSNQESDLYGTVPSSKNLNYYLRNRFAGNDRNHPAKQQGIKTDSDSYDDSHILKALNHLDDMFKNKKNTNRMKLHVFSGIPIHVGEYFETLEIGSIHTLPSFTSTSTHFDTAVQFAIINSDFNNNIHVIHFTLTPGAGISIARHSELSENEILLKYGTQFRYDGSYTYHSPINVTIRIHDVVVFPINDRKHPALTVDDYGPYHHPKTN